MVSNQPWVDLNQGWSRSPRSNLLRSRWRMLGWLTTQHLVSLTADRSPGARSSKWMIWMSSGITGRSTYHFITRRGKNQEFRRRGCIRPEDWGCKNFFLFLKPFVCSRSLVFHSIGNFFLTIFSGAQVGFICKHGFKTNTIQSVK